jgi:hypothetical protein
MLIGTVLWSLFEVVFALTPTYYWGLGILVLTGMAQASGRGPVVFVSLCSMLSGAAAEEMGAPLTTIVGATDRHRRHALGVAPWMLSSRRG